jgi:hypothetical protein
MISPYLLTETDKLQWTLRLALQAGRRAATTYSHLNLPPILDFCDA